MKTEYSKMGKQLTMRVSVQELDRATQVDLWTELCEALGIIEAAHAAPEASEWFQLQWVKIQQSTTEGVLS